MKKNDNEISRTIISIMPTVLLQMMQKSTVNFKERKLKDGHWSSSSLSSSSFSTVIITFCCYYCCMICLLSTSGIKVEGASQPSTKPEAAFTSSLNNKTIVQGEVSFSIVPFSSRNRNRFISVVYLYVFYLPPSPPRPPL